MPTCPSLLLAFRSVVAGLLVPLAIGIPAKAVAEPPRQIVELRDGWRFAPGDQPQASEADYDDATWQQVEVPHDWSIAGPFDESNPAGGDGAFLPTGVAWYRLALPAAVTSPDKRVFLEFDGIMANSDVWINGHHLGHRPNGYVTFRYELTEHLTLGPGAANVVAVRSDTQQQVASRWYTGSGIYRKVRAIVVDPLHVRDSATFITTPEVAPERARVHVAATIDNQGRTTRQCQLQVVLLSPDGQQVASAVEPLRVDAAGQADAACDLEVPRPVLWGIGEGNRYTAMLRLSCGEEIVDQTTTRFGIRQVEFRSPTGFWLNGRNLKIKGVCLHHDGGAFGAAVPKSIWRDRLVLLRQQGVNGVRTAHNPPAPELLDLCDELGLVVMDEFFDCWTMGKRSFDYHLYFDEWARRDEQATILRDRNHPSIVLYSVGNEIRDMHNTEAAKRVLGTLVDVCHENDPTRPVTQALFRPNTTHDYDNGVADLLDVIGTNYRDAELLQAWHDKPGRKIIGTEQAHERSTWLACRDHPQHAGQFLWVGVDYLGESRRWPVTTFDSGLVDRTGRVYPRGFERQSWWSGEPMVHAFRRIAATEATPADPGYEAVEWRRRQVLFDDWSPRYLADSPTVETIEVYSNCAEVRLELNGQSLGTQPLPTDARPRVWKVPFERGELVAIGLDGGQEVARHALRTCGLAEALELSCNRSELPADWDEVATVRATIVDAQGTPVPGANQPISFEVTGPARIVATDNGSIVDLEPFQSTERHAHRGQCVAYLRATGEPGEIRVTAHADQLLNGPASAAVLLRVVP